jgi:hypothetical protein
MAVSIISSEEILVHLFCLVDDLVSEIQTNQLNPPTQNSRGRTAVLCSSEIVTLGILYQWSGIKSVKGFYETAKHHKLYQQAFPAWPSYKIFVEQMNLQSTLALNILVILLACNRTTHTQRKQHLQFVDATPLPVCKNKRISSHKVAKEVAELGKSSTGWFYGFKLHITCNEQGELLSVTITPGNTDDRTPLKKLFKHLKGIVVGDAGYVSEKWKEYFEKIGIHLFTATKKTMKKLMTKLQHCLLKRRQRIESVFHVLKDNLNMVSSLPRSVNGHFARYIYGLVAYCFMQYFQGNSRFLIS